MRVLSSKEIKEIQEAVAEAAAKKQAEELKAQQEEEELLKKLASMSDE